MLLLSVSNASTREHLFQNERICDTADVFCFHGSLSYHSNSRVLHLRARVQKAPGPGLLRIRVTGANELGHRRLAPIEVRVRGNHSEIINLKVIPDHPDVRSWAVDLVSFIPDEAPN